MVINEAKMVDSIMSAMKAFFLGYNKTIKAGKKPNKDASYLNGSISNYTKNLILTFPMMCDNSLSPSTASMISKANERNIVTMLEMLFASMTLKGENGVEILSKIHKNINANISLDDMIEIVDNAIDKKAVGEAYSNAEFNSCLKLMMEQLKTPQKSFPVESLSERSLNDYTVYNIHGNVVVREDIKTEEEIEKMSDAEIDAYNKKLNVIQKQREIQAKDREEANNKAKVSSQNMSDFTNSISRQLLDSDVKKANELQPTLMVVKFHEVDKDGVLQNSKPFISGVKSRLIPVDSTDIVDRVIVKNKTKVNFLNFIRATTGEIGFIKDFIFCIDQAKIDAKNGVKKGEAAKMWKVLEYRSSKNFRNKNKRTGNDASAITTLVINQETVNILKKEHDFDLEKISNARMILDSYNLLGLFIVDESIEVVKFLYTGNDMFEQQAYSYLEKESNDNSYKKVINLIGKMNGR